MANQIQWALKSEKPIRIRQFIEMFQIIIGYFDLQLEEKIVKYSVVKQKIILAF